MAKTLEKAIYELKESLTFAMSLGAKELFHSNVWAWLIEKDPAFIKAFFPDEFDVSDFSSVKREKEHKDITIFVKNPEKGCYVIENKIKSIPDAEQLEKYTENTESGLLTGIEETLDIPKELNGKWKFKSYCDIAKEIKAIAKKSKVLSDDAKTNILKYASDIENIDLVLKASLDSVKGKYCFECSKEDDLQNLRIYDIFQKLKNELFANELRKELYKIYKDENKYQIETGFSNSSSIITIFKYFDENEKVDKTKKRRIGIQIQSDQYRHYCESYNTSDFEECKKCGWFEEKPVYDESTNEYRIFGKTTSFGKKKQTSTQDGFCHYGKTFLYQYYKLKENGLEDEDKLIKQILDDFGKIDKIKIK